ncbi:hypothetical protein B0T14DRAFT_523978 [Immersiella caudata]|uniref:Uncharacterized protein n=1 Tax=Immersiella caudata TaxID=314043 RepID=A0AA40BX24_9PEZI|nr:hypothetical protein B0T14DRAFT_523978 [Immersiella caudata]
MGAALGNSKTIMVDGAAVESSVLLLSGVLFFHVSKTRASSYPRTAAATSAATPGRGRFACRSSSRFPGPCEVEDSMSCGMPETTFLLSWYGDSGKGAPGKSIPNTRNHSSLNGISPEDPPRSRSC